MKTYENLTTYNPGEIEGKWYSYWENQGYFHEEVDTNKEPFSIVLPPPNVTGMLHMGHALDNTLQDILIRFKRMQGYNVLWMPGTDHAGIATQIKVEEMLAKEEGKSRYDLGREKFVERVWEWKKEYGDTIVKQIRSLGASCDWTRERFTLDEGYYHAVREVFVSLYEKGLIYRGERIINWCPRCATALSDVEVEHEDEHGHLWHIKYPVKGEENRFVIVATTRPETMFGDVAVAVNPDDDRYKDLIGKTLILPFVNREIPVIADDYVDASFGTGCVKITPAHDPNDFEMGQRHNLESIVVMNNDATMNEGAGKFNGMTREEARKQVVAELKELGLLEKIDDHDHAVGHCSRCNTIIEPMVSKQWFVDMKPLAEPALKVVKDHEVEFVPERFTKTYVNWLENIRDWTISRQLWWGHRIPAWYCDDCGETIVSREDITECPHCHGHVTQDPDVLDTWFSSGLWPFATMGWPEQTPELKQWYPTSVLVTGYDIIFFWVARMIFSACENMGSAPFKTVFMHGIVRDENGIKMSKSLGNGIDPLEVIDKYGADALRFFLATGNTPGNDMRYSDKRVEACANFANKLWNASRYVHMNIDDHDVKNELPKTLTTEDKWIVSTLNTVAKEVNENLEKFELGIAVQKIYEFIWDCYCDWYIELVKTRLSSDGEDAQNARQVLLYVLDQILRLLHPFMPYITEEIWQTIPHEGETVMLAKYPEYNAELDYPEASDEMKKIMDAIRAIRNRRAEMNVPPSRKAKVYVATKFADTFKDGTQFIQKLASASEVEVAESFEIEGAVNIVTADAKIYIPMDELVDREKELARLNKELEQVKKRLAQSEGKLNNQGFVAKAPEAVIEKVKGQAAKEREQIALIEAAIAALK